MTCSHETRNIVFRFREYDVRGRVCNHCGERFFNESDLDKIPVDELKLGFLAEVKEV